MRRSAQILCALPSALWRAGPRVAHLRAGEVTLLAQAPLALPLVAALLRAYGLSGVVERLTARPRPVSRLPPEEQHESARRVAWCVMVAAAYGPWPANCLQRSVTICWFLHRRGLAGDLRVGVRPDDQGGLDFHCWVEHDGTVLNDTRDVAERYAVFGAAGQPEVAR